MPGRTGVFEGTRLLCYKPSRKTFLGRRGRVDTTPRPDDFFHTVVVVDRVDLLVPSYLGQAELWRRGVIDFNKLPFFNYSFLSGTPDPLQPNKKF